MDSSEALGEQCEQLKVELLDRRSLIVAANRGPVSIQTDDDGSLLFQRGGGGLVTALIGLARHVEATWIGSALNEVETQWKEGEVPLDDSISIRVKFISVPDQVYEGYYNVIANPLLWFLQHNMWDLAKAPTIDRDTWHAWEHGYVKVNHLFADTIADQIEHSPRRALVMFHDYHLYLAPKFLRNRITDRNRCTLTHFVHIPWPGPEVWGFLPGRMRRAILEGLCAVDLLGFQTREDSLNFIRTCESQLPGAQVKFKKGTVWFRDHTTYVRDFPISIDVDALKELAGSQEVEAIRLELLEDFHDAQLIVRIDRTEPSKNIVRGFQAFEEMLDLFPQHKGKVKFLALLVSSRMEVEEYQDYLDELMAAAGRVNAKHGDSEWEPVRMLMGEDYARAVAALQLYDVLLVNSIADGMNLVAKEGPIVNQRDGVVILSERTGARQQLEPGALVISPCDVFATAEAMHQALTMAPEQRAEMARRLHHLVEAEDITEWLCKQLDAISKLNL